jgi:hypothetical protein
MRSDFVRTQTGRRLPGDEDVVGDVCAWSLPKRYCSSVMVIDVVGATGPGCLVRLAFMVSRRVISSYQLH